MSDYLTNLAAKSIHQNQGFRFAAGELRPRLPARFEGSPAAAWSNSAAELEETIEHETSAPRKSSRLRHSKSIGLAQSFNDVDAMELRPAATAAPRPRSVIQAARDEPVRSQTPPLDSRAEPETPPLERYEYEAKEPHQLPLTPRPGAASLSAAMLRGSGGKRETQRLSAYPREARHEPIDLSRPGQIESVDRAEPSDRAIDGRPANQPALRSPERNSVRRPEKTDLIGQDERMAIAAHSQQVLQHVIAQLSATPVEATPGETNTVNVTIGRIEVRAAPPAPAPANKPPATPVITLDEYVRRRAAGGS